MPPTSNHRSPLFRLARPWWLLPAVLVACVALMGPAPAQLPPCPPTVSGVPLTPVPTPEKPPRPPTGPDSVASFVDGLTGNDAAFEVLLGEGRILTTKEPLSVPNKPPALIAVGDPSVIDFVPVSPRQIRVLGLRMGVTDLSITTSDEKTYTFEVRVVADLNALRGQLHCLFPDAALRVSQMRDNIVVEGQARDATQVARVLDTIQVYLSSIQAAQARRAAGGPPPRGQIGKPKGDEGPPAPPAPAPDAAVAVPATLYRPQIINLIRVPGTQQVLLKVRVAELNRTGMRQIGADLFFVDPNSGKLLGTQIGGGNIHASGIVGSAGSGNIINRDPNRTFFDTSPVTTVFGIFNGAHFEFLLSALRRNSLVKILAEPNLVAMNGQQASFLAGGEFPVPVPQTSTGGAGTSVTVLFKSFGVSLNFLPFILDGDVIRLTVDPEVSSLDFAIGAVLVPGGTPVPGVDTRKAHTTVEMRQGQTLAIAGLLQLQMEGNTGRIPGVGDLPIIGPFFSNTTSNRIEKELIVLVTPYLVDPLNPDQVGPSPGDEVKGPNDLEFYLFNRIEGRTGKDWRATTDYDAPLFTRCLLKLHNDNVSGPHGFCD
jgi:pilus assembly protein CpaC